MIRLIPIALIITYCVAVASLSIYKRVPPDRKFFPVRSRNKRSDGSVKCGVDSLDDIYFGCDQASTKANNVFRAFYDDIYDETRSTQAPTEVVPIFSTINYVRTSRPPEYTPIGNGPIDTDLSNYDDMFTDSARVRPTTSKRIRHALVRLKNLITQSGVPKPHNRVLIVRKPGGITVRPTLSFAYPLKITKNIKTSASGETTGSIETTMDVETIATNETTISGETNASKESDTTFYENTTSTEATNETTI